MRNMMIDDATLNDLQISGWPEMVITDEVLMDIERKKKHYVAVQQKKEAESRVCGRGSSHNQKRM